MHHDHHMITLSAPMFAVLGSLVLLLVIGSVTLVVQLFKQDCQAVQVNPLHHVTINYSHTLTTILLFQVVQ